MKTLIAQFFELFHHNTSFLQGCIHASLSLRVNGASLPTHCGRSYAYVSTIWQKYSVKVKVRVSLANNFWSLWFGSCEFRYFVARLFWRGLSRFYVGSLCIVVLSHRSFVLTECFDLTLLWKPVMFLYSRIHYETFRPCSKLPFVESWSVSYSFFSFEDTLNLPVFLTACLLKVL